MKIVLPRIQQNTTKFRIDTLEPMILLGGKIANFSKFAGDYLKRKRALRPYSKPSRTTLRGFRRNAPQRSMSSVP
jgi:hypothetical protein